MTAGKTINKIAKSSQSNQEDIEDDLLIAVADIHCKMLQENGNLFFL